MSAILSVDSERITPSTSDLTGTERYIPHPKYAGCHWCHQFGSSSRPLKRCAKCAVVLYCSKECQVASWRTHRPDCVAPIRSERTGKLTKAYGKWAEVHQLCLDALAGGLVRSTGGKEFNLTNGRSLVITLFPHIDTWEDGNPAKWFSIADARMCNKDGNPFLDTRGKKLTSGQPQDHQSAIADLIPVGGKPEPDILGFLPVTYFIVNEGITIHDLHSIRGADAKVLEATQPWEVGLDEEELITDTYADLANLCIICINTGIVLRDPTDQGANRFLPEIGSYVRARRSGHWRWVRRADAWEILNEVMHMPDSGMNLKAGWTAEKLLMMWGLRLCY